MTCRLPVLVLLVAAVTACAAPTGKGGERQTGSVLPPDVQAAFTHLTARAFHAHLAYLSDDLLEGRGTATRGHELAAKYVAAQFERIGLQPGGDGGTYFQQVPLREATITPQDSHLAIVRRTAAPDVLRFGRDFITVGPVSEPLNVEAPVVFVNYGVVAPVRHDDDYAGVDAAGKIVAVLLGGPPGIPPVERAYFEDAVPRTAAAHGALAVLYLSTPPLGTAQAWARAAGGAGFPVMELRGRGANPKAAKGFQGSFALSPAETTRLFTGSTKPYAQALADAAAGRPNTFALPISIRLRIAGRTRDLTSPNVIGVLRGSDPVLRNQYLVYSAHLDHLGIGAPVKGDRIYNGTADDASGCAALIVLAHAFASMPRRPRRSILFLATTGEEKHLLGSEYFSRAPTVPKQALVADLNMDVVAMHYLFTDMIARGAEQSSLEALVRRDLARLGLTLARDPSPEQMLFMRSDQYSFAKQGIPSLYISEGDHASDPAFDARKFWMEWDRDRYHEPSDDMSQPMDLAATVEYLRPMLLIGWDIANDPQRPDWNRQDFLGRTFSDLAVDAAPTTASSR